VGLKSNTTTISESLAPFAPATFSYVMVISFVPACCIVVIGVPGKLPLLGRAAEKPMFNDDFIQNNCRSGIHYSNFCRKQ
jgi:hypothetical protein